MEVVRLSVASIPIRIAFAGSRARVSAARPWRSVLGCAAGVSVVALGAVFAHRFAWLLPAGALVNLAIVVSVALLFGFPESAVVSLAAALAPGFFAPHSSWLQAARDPANAVALAAFLFAALVVGRLRARVAAAARDTESWRKEMRDLCEFTRRTLEMNLNVEPGPRLAELVNEIFSVEAVAIFDADLHQAYEAGYWSQDPRELAQNVYYFGTSDDDATGLSRRVLKLGAAPIGSLVLRGETSPLTSNAIAALIATTFDRYRAFANESQIETERRAEQLRATVLDSLAHAYKTPLTAIRAAASGLSEMGRMSAAQAELVSLIDEQAGVLNELTTRLLTTARLDAGEVALEAEAVEIQPLIDDVVAGLKDRLAGRKVSIQLGSGRRELCCDRQLIGALLTQYIDNACKYSIYGTAITIAVARRGAETVFSVHSLGAEIPPGDRERIFDRYYRASSSSGRTEGTGIGLAVAKRAAQMHGGHVWVSSDEAQGTTFFAAIPTAAAPRSRI
jgi:two-component system, OmpR family, sensor histidine kinase KdpD